MKYGVLLLVGAAAWGQALDPKRCETLKHHGDPGTLACYQQLARSNDPMIRAEGLWGTRDYKGAFNLFKDREEAQPKDAKVRVRLGYLLLDHFQEDEAAGYFEDALKIEKDNAEAMLGLALVEADGFEGEAKENAERALKADPKLYRAHELLAKIALEDNDPAKAEAEVKAALAVSPEALDGMAVMAANDLLKDGTGKEWFDRIFKINPKYGEANAIAGHFFVINRRYDEGEAQYRKAIALDPQNYPAKAELALGLLRFARNEEARKLFDECWNAGYQSREVKNALDLMDTFKNYDRFETPTTVLIMHKKESALFRPYFQAQMDKNIHDYEIKYKHKLTGKFQLEVYPNHDDFAVRTSGIPGLGISGVTFGNFVGMDSPTARKPGEFHWASTLRHEMSHVFVISMTNHRVPRWFTEGMAVYEETAENADWGDRLDHTTIQALKEKKLLPIAELDSGFVHQAYQGQVIVSYYQAGRICSFIAEKFGYDKLLAMIKDFGDKMETVDVVKKEFKMEPAEFDKQFFAWNDEKTKKTVDGFDDWRKRMQGINEANKLQDWDKVIAEGNAIRDTYPDYVEAGSTYEFLANAYAKKGDKAKQIAELKRYSEVGGREPELLEKLADLQIEAGAKRDAAVTLERLMLIYLSDEKPHKTLGDVEMDLGASAVAIREYQAVLAAKPVDPAGAHYNLARAFNAAKRADDARDEVFAALEIAPSFKPAQKLLLDLEKGAKP